MVAHSVISRFIRASAVLFCGLTASGQGHQDAPRHTDALVVCQGATETRWTTLEGTEQLSYQIEAEYPASSVVSCISKKLSETGWRPLQKDYWNPGLPSSHVRGWTQFADATVQPSATVDQWAGQWENKAGDIVWYFLRYKYPPGDRHTLAVNAGFVSANVAKKMPKTPNLQEVVGAPSIDSCTFPPGLRDEISKKYPGTGLLSLRDLDEYDLKLFQKDHGNRCPGLVRVDFYGDGKPTWALVLIAGEGSKGKAELVVAHQVADGWETRSLETADGEPVVWREGPGEYSDVYGQKTIRATRPVIVLCGYESWAILYAWTGKEVEKIWLSD